MPTEVTKILNDLEMEFTAGANVTCGEVLVAGHKVGVVASLEGVANGETGILTIRGIAYLPAASGTTFAQGANVQFNTSTNLAVASGGTHAGRALYAKVSGETTVAVELNVPATS